MVNKHLYFFLTLLSNCKRAQKLAPCKQLYPFIFVQDTSRRFQLKLMSTQFPSALYVSERLAQDKHHSERLIRAGRVAQKCDVLSNDFATSPPT